MPKKTHPTLKKNLLKTKTYRGGGSNDKSHTPDDDSGGLGDDFDITKDSAADKFMENTKESTDARNQKMRTATLTHGTEAQKAMELSKMKSEVDNGKIEAPKLEMNLSQPSTFNSTSNNSGLNLNLSGK